MTVYCARIDKRGPGRTLIARDDILAFSIASPSCEHNVSCCSNFPIRKRENFKESDSKNFQLTKFNRKLKDRILKYCVSNNMISRNKIYMR